MLVGLLLAGCVPRGDALTERVADLGGVTVADPGPTVFLRELRSTSGSDVDRVLDADGTTGWTPGADPAGEGIDLVFEEPLPVSGIVVRACDGAPEARVHLFPNGTSGPTLHLVTGRDTVQELSDVQCTHGLRDLSLRFEGSGPPPCIAELGLLRDGVEVPLRPPRELHAQLRASSVEEPVPFASPAWLVDGRTDFGWVAQSRVGERVLVTLDEPAEISALEIWGGDEVPTRLSVEVDGAEPFLAGLAAKRGPQRIELPAPIDTGGLALIVDQAPAGTGGIGLAELRLWDRHGPLVIRSQDAAELERTTAEASRDLPIGGVLDVEWHSVCGYPRRTLKLRANTTFSRSDAAVRWPGGLAPERFDGEWAYVSHDGPWSTVGVRGTHRRLDARWEDDAAASERAGSAWIEVARLSDLGPQAFRDLVESWGRGASRDRVDCLTEELGAWTDAWDTLVAQDALVVRGEGLDDLLWREGGGG
jgi:hypothetical protein